MKGTNSALRRWFVYSLIGSAVYLGVTLFVVGARAQIDNTNQTASDPVIVTEQPAVEVTTPPATETAVTDETVPPDQQTANEPVVVEETSTPVLIQPTLTPELSTDKADYHPGETVTIFGKFFKALENIVLRIFGGSAETENFVDQSVDVAADEAGSFTKTITLPEMFVATYEAVAKTVSGEQLAATTFTDSLPTDFSQCTNNNPTPGSCNWIGSIIQQNNSIFYEGMTVPQRLLFRDFAGSGQVNITFSYEYTKAGIHAYDFLTTVDPRVSDPSAAQGNYPKYSPGTAVLNPCANLQTADYNACLAINPKTPAVNTVYPVNVPLDGFISKDGNQKDKELAYEGLYGYPRQIIIYSSKPSAISFSPYPVLSLTHNVANGGDTGDSEAAANIRFYVPSNTCTTQSPCNFLLYFGGHLALTGNGLTQTWGQGLGSAQINGGPYHINKVKFNGVGGSQDNQIKGADVLIPPGTITLDKDTDPAGDQTLFDFSTTGGLTPSTVQLAHSTAPQVWNSVANGNTYTITETPVSGWALLTPVCSGATLSTIASVTNGVSITMNGGESIVCKFINKLQQANLTVIKHVINDNGGSATSGEWTMNVTGNNPSQSLFAGSESPGTTITINAGSYSVDESGGPAGYTKTLGIGCTGTIAAGESKTCIITNDDIAPSLNLNKIVVNDNGGNATESSWEIFASGSVKISGPGAAGGTDVVSGSTFPAGTYTLSESSGPAGYSASNWSCVINNGSPVVGSSITLALGDVAICTITNDDIAPSLKLVKQVTNDNGGAKTPSDWTLTASGIGGFSDGGDSATFHNVNANTSYALSESVVAGYSSGSWSCNGGTLVSNNITLGLATNVTCTIVNNDQPGTLIVKKIVINDNGGTAATSSFSFSVNGATSTNFEADGQNDLIVNAGTYSVTEPVVNGYATAYDNCTNLVIPNGGTATCTIINDDIAPKLTIKKHVINNNGGVKVASDFTMNVVANNPSSSTFPGSEAGTQITLNAGAYEVGESLISGYTMSTSTNCTGSIAIGEEKTCTVTNDDEPAHLIVIKHVDNGNTGATTTASAFTIHINGTAGSANFAGSENPGISTVLNAGNYEVSEDVMTGYVMTTSTDCVGSITNGETKTCTITNAAVAPKLTLVKTVVNDNGGLATTSSFQVKIDNNNVVWEEAQTLTIGSHVASEVEVVGYSSSNWGTDCGPNGTINLNLGDVKICTITNDDVAPKLHLRKIIINNNGGNATTTDFTLTADGTGSNDISGYSPVDSTGTLKADTFALSESANVVGYASSSWECVGGSQNGSNITLGIGEEATCTITNDDLPGTLIVKKIVIKDNGGTAATSSFSFSVNGNTSTNFESDGQNELTVNADTYTVTEPNVVGYTTTYDNCADLVIPNGGSSTCTITNDDQPGQIKIVKHTVDGDATFNFTISGPTQSTQNINTSNGTGETELITVNAGGYSVEEGALTGWAMTSSTCTSGTPGSFTVPNGGSVTCTFTNSKPGAQIDVTPISAVNKVGDNHTITSTVQVHNGNGIYVNAPDGTLVEFSFATNTASAAFVGSNTCTTIAGVCSVQISSTQTGLIGIHASSTPSELGVALHVETDGTGDNSSDAQKTYVNARISITPATSTNEVRDDHTFVVTVEKDDGSGSGWTPVAAGTLANATSTPKPTSFDASDCTNGVDVNGQCNVIINSNNAGVFTITARSTVVVGGITFKLQTNGSLSNSGPAVKTYVDAKIVLSPLTATNNIGSPHTITSTVSQNTGSGLTAAPDGTLVTFGLVNNTAGASFVGGVNTCTTTGGACSVQINSPTPGSVDINATTTFSVLGVSLTRATGDGLSDDSANANKLYIAGALEVTKIVDLSGYIFATSTNQVFTVTVTGPSFPLGTTTEFHLENGVLQAPTTVSFGPIIVGPYSVAENNPGLAWSVTSSTGNVVVISNATSTQTITNTIKKPNTTLSVISNTYETAPGGNVVLTISDTNDGSVPLSNNTVTITYSTTTVTLSKSSPEYVGGDTNNNNLMDPNETWTWNVSIIISTNTTINITGDGIDPLGNHVSPATGYQSEAGSVSIRVIGTTRTLGFWQTHTLFTSAIFNSSSPFFVGVNTTSTTGTHKGILINPGQLLGGFYAPIAKISTGAKRQPDDQARITLLQQLLAAKLNCAAFNCSATVQGQIAAADAAYAAGNKGTIMSYVSILDSFNNSGDANAIPAGLPATGKATPKQSQAAADIKFWDQP
jgi:hypothetical protein